MVRLLSPSGAQRLLVLCWLALSAACGDGGDDSSGTGGGVGAGPSEVCPPGERELDDHSCVPAGLGDHAFAPGVPADGCGPGFVHDGEYGCDAVLPDMPCGPGSYAVPGETSCSRFDACGTDPWPAAVGDVIYVDAGFNPGNGDGSIGMPFNELDEAVAAAAPGAVIALASGSYAGGVVVDKPVTIWGRCAEMVSVAGQGASALRFAAGSTGSTLRDVALTGTGIGLEVVDAAATLEWVWIHDTGGYAVSLLYGSAPTSLALHDVLIEAATDRGLYAEGASVVADRVVVRDVTGRGINVRDHQPSGVAGHLELSTALVERTREVALMVHASDAIVDNSVIADTLPLSTGRFGRAASVQHDTTSSTKATLAMTRSNVERAYDGGIVGSGTAIDLEHVTVRDVAANVDEGHRGYGVQVGYNRMTQDRGSLSARRSLIERCHEAGISVVSSDADIDALVIRSTSHVTPLIPDLPEKYGGRGLNLQNDPDAADVGHAVVDGSLFDDNVESAIVVQGSVLDLVHSVVQGTRSLEPHYGRGITAQDNTDGGARSFVTVRESELIDNTEVNLFVIGSMVTVESSLIRDTQPRPDGDLGIGVNVELRSENGNAGRAELYDSAVLDSRVSGVSAFAAEILIAHTVVTGSTANPDGEFGDGVVGIAYYDVPSTIEVSQCSVAGNQRAGAATFGALMSISATRFDCNDFHLDTETFNGRDGEFSDMGGNVCGCGGNAVVCKALSSSLHPPDPPPVK